MSNVFAMTDTWNNGATVFSAIQMIVTNTASAAGSKVLDLQIVSGASASIDKLATLKLTPTTAAGTVPVFWAASSGAGYAKIFDNGTMIIDSDAGSGTTPLTIKYNGGTVASFNYLGNLNAGGIFASGVLYSIGAIVNGAGMATIASAATIAPGSVQAVKVSGTAAIDTITSPFGGNGGAIDVIPTGIFTWTAAGNIAIAGTAVVNRGIRFVYDLTAAKWYPSYI